MVGLAIEDKLNDRSVVHHIIGNLRLYCRRGESVHGLETTKGEEDGCRCYGDHKTSVPQVQRPDEVEGHGDDEGYDEAISNEIGGGRSSSSDDAVVNRRCQSVAQDGLKDQDGGHLKPKRERGCEKTIFTAIGSAEGHDGLTSVLIELIGEEYSEEH